MKFEEWVFLMLGTGLGCLFTLLIQALHGASQVSAEGFSSLLTAIAVGGSAVATARLAWKGFTRWEVRHRRERQAEVAAQAFVAAWEMHEKFHAGTFWFSLGTVTKEVADKTLEVLKETGIQSRFDAAFASASAYLDDACIDGLTRMRSAFGAAQLALLKCSFSFSPSVRVEMSASAAIDVEQAKLQMVEAHASLKAALKRYVLLN